MGIPSIGGSGCVERRSGLRRPVAGPPRRPSSWSRSAPRTSSSGSAGRGLAELSRAAVLRRRLPDLDEGGGDDTALTPQPGLAALGHVGRDDVASPDSSAFRAVDRRRRSPRWRRPSPPNGRPDGAGGPKTSVERVGNSVGWCVRSANPDGSRARSGRPNVGSSVLAPRPERLERAAAGRSRPAGRRRARRRSGTDRRRWAAPRGDR